MLPETSARVKDATGIAVVAGPVMFVVLDHVLTHVDSEEHAGPEDVNYESRANVDKIVVRLEEMDAPGIGIDRMLEYYHRKGILKTEPTNG